MKVVLQSLVVCLVLVFSFASCTKKEAAPEGGEPAAAEQVEGKSTAPSDATPEDNPEEMQKKDNSNKAAEE